MSMYSASRRIKQTEDVSLVPSGIFAGEPECTASESHYPAGTSRHNRWRATPMPTPAATGVFIEWTNSQKKGIDFIALLCNKHGGTIKSIISRSSWRSGDLEWAEGVSPADVMRIGVEAFIAARIQTEQHAKAAQEAQYRANELATAREGWAEHRADYNEPAGKRKQVILLSNQSDDPYARVFVVSTRNDMTPNEARAYAAELLRFADQAADQTAMAVKP